MQIRLPMILGALLLLAGILWRAAETPAPTLPRTPEELQKILAFQRAERPILALDVKYRIYAGHFLFTASAEEVASVKARIDAELAELARIKDEGLGAAFAALGAAIAAVDIVLMAAGAALMFHSLAFVLALGFGAGVYHRAAADGATLTGSASELYLGAIAAALIWSAAAWFLRRLAQRRRVV